jgi:cytidine deaminase
MGVRRFINLLFGNNEVTPTHDEYGMYLAKSASLRSSDLSRQVGAAIFRPSGEIATLGCNEVPKAGGGTYWSGDSADARDFVAGHDPNDVRKIEILVDLLDRLKKGRHLSENLMKIDDSNEIGKALLADEGHESVRESRVMDIIEFGRIIHAEMSAISDAAQKGISIESGTLYCTTFPCHLCAKHIVATGLAQVVYLEPYPKSYASELHGDSIAVEHSPERGQKVLFRAFVGVSPYRYRDLFEKGKRKYSGGSAQRWNKDNRRPMIEVYFPSYFKAEAIVVGQVRQKLEAIIATHFAATESQRPAEAGSSS